MGTAELMHHQRKLRSVCLSPMTFGSGFLPYLSLLDFFSLGIPSWIFTQFFELVPFSWTALVSLDVPKFLTTSLASLLLFFLVVVLIF